MCCDELLCARCARPVADAACPVCRAARAELHGSPGISPWTFLAVFVALLSLAALLSTALTA
jgi:hypothetical protein